MEVLLERSAELLISISIASLSIQSNFKLRLVDKWNYNAVSNPIACASYFKDERWSTNQTIETGLVGKTQSISLL